MKSSTGRVLALIVAVVFCPAVARSEDFLAAIQAPKNLEAPAGVRPVVIAIVDDGFRVTHQELQPFIWHNPKEIPGNRVDDDGNGRIDDVAGWDESDRDDDVSPPPGREEMFSHGTRLAGIITQVARRVYGKAAPDLIKILPVKTLSDNADDTYLKEGYAGIQYAVDTGADIILTAWGVPNSSPSELRALQSAQDRGVLVVASAGNHPDEKEQFPAAFPSVLAVTGIEASGVKLEQATYGGFVDLAAPGLGITSADVASDTAQSSSDGTSMSAAIVAAAAAVVKLQHPGITVDELIARLKNTAEPLEPFQSGDIFYGGKLGAGRLNLSAAVSYDLNSEPINVNQESRRHQGFLAVYRPPEQLVLWQIRPEGQVDGFWFDPPTLEGDPGETRIKFFQAGPIGENPFADLKLSDWTERQYVPGVQATVLLESDAAHSDFKFLSAYASKPIDQSVLYCRDTVEINAEGIIEDGSGPENYSPQCSCKWLITAPEGKVIQIRFLEFDTEVRTDWLYAFDGAGTQEPIMAVFSGPDIPPVLTTWHRQALLWFVTDSQHQGKGWKAQITFVDPTPSP